MEPIRRSRCVADPVSISVLLVVLFAMMVPVFFDPTHTEYFTWWLCQQDFATLTKMTAQDVHPPLYYWIAKLATKLFGDSIVAIRLLSGLFGVAMVFFARELYCRAVRTKVTTAVLPTAALVCVVVGLNATNIAYAHWARMYSLMGLLGVCGALAAIRCSRSTASNIDWLALLGISVLLTLSHHYSAVFAATTYLWLGYGLMRRFGLRSAQFRRFALAAATCLIVVSPSLLVAARQVAEVRESFWIAQTGGMAVISACAGYFVPVEGVYLSTPIAVVVTAALVLVLAPLKCSEFEHFFLTQVGAIALVVLAASTIANRPIFVPRYLSTLYPLAGLYFVSRTRLLPSETLRHMAILFLVVNTLASTVGLAMYLPGRPNDPTFRKKYRETATNLQSFAREGTWVVYRDPRPYVRHHYFADRTTGRVLFWNPEEIGRSSKAHVVFLSAVLESDRITDDQLRQLTGNRIVLFANHETLPAEIPGWVAAPSDEGPELPTGASLYVRPSSSTETTATEDRDET